MATAWQTPVWIDVSQEPGTLILSLRGELDTLSRDTFESAVMAAIPTAYAVVLDLGGLTFCDSTGLAMFLAAAEKAAASETTLTFRNVHPTVWRLFQISGIDHVLDITE